MDIAFGSGLHTVTFIRLVRLLHFGYTATIQFVHIACYCVLVYTHIFPARHLRYGFVHRFIYSYRYLVGSGLPLFYHFALYTLHTAFYTFTPLHTRLFALLLPRLPQVHCTHARLSHITRCVTGYPSPSGYPVWRLPTAQHTVVYTAVTATVCRLVLLHTAAYVAVTFGYIHLPSSATRSAPSFGCTLLAYVTFIWLFAWLPLEHYGPHLVAVVALPVTHAHGWRFTTLRLHDIYGSYTVGLFWLRPYTPVRLV